MITAWTDERVDLLKQLWGTGLSASQIAGEIGVVSRNAVIGKASRLGLVYGQDRTAGPRPGKARMAVASRRRRLAGPNASKDNALLHRIATPAPKGPPPIPVADGDTPLDQRKALLDLRNDTCRWPIGDPSSPDFFFCGAPDADLVRGHPYCRHHEQIATGRYHATTESHGRYLADRKTFTALKEAEQRAA